MRTLLPILLLGATAAFGQPVTRTQIDMCPGVEQEQRQQLYRAFYAKKGQIDRANGRIGQINVALRKKPGGEQAKKLRAERARLQKQVPALHRQMFAEFRKAGLTDAQIARLPRIPTGPLREELYNHSVVLEAPDLTPAQQTLLGRLVASIDAAQRALHVQHRYLQGTLKDADPLVRRQFNAAFYNGRNQMERRFWQVVYYALTQDQMVAVRKLFSPRYRYLPQLEQQLYTLPKMTPSQATRVRALFREHESEIAADQAAVRRLGIERKTKKLSKAESNAKLQEIRDCQARMAALNTSFRDALMAVVDEHQLAALRGRAPLLNVGEYYQGMRRALGEIKPSAEQTRAIAKVRKEIQDQQRVARKLYNDAMGSMRGADLGPDSPQAMTMQMMQRNMAASNFSYVRAGAQRVLLEVLTPEQVANWVVAPVVRP